MSKQITKRMITGKLTAMMLAVTIGAAMIPASVAAEEVTAETATAEAATAYADPAVVVTNSIPGWPMAQDINSDYGCLMDYTTGAILFDKGMDVQMPPASLTKIMTTLLALENCNLDDKVTMTQTGVDYATDGSSNLYTAVGEELVLRDMLYGVMLKSANDMATQVGEYVGGGSLDHFLDMMNERAVELGCTNTHFANACGMPADNHYTTAHDLALICREALKNEEFRKIISTKEYTIPQTNLITERTFASHHPFVSDPAYAYEGTIGGKTGYTDAALNTLATFVKQGDRTLICVTLHASDRALSCDDAKALFDYGFANFENKRVKVTKDVLSGGIVTIPVGVDKSTLGRKKTFETDSKEGELQITTYNYEGQTVGEAVQSVQYLEEKKAKEEAAARAQSAADSVEEAAVPSDKVSDTSGSSAGINKNSAAADKVVSLPFGIMVNKGAFTAIAVLAAAVLLGLICIIITLLARGNDED